MAKPKKPEPPSEETLLLADYCEKGLRLGCPPQQLDNFMKAGIMLQDKQLEFASKCRECDKVDGPTSVMYSGGRGSSKTHGLVAQVFADDCARLANLKALILRKVGKANREQINDFRSRMLSYIPHTYKEQQGTFTINSTNAKVIINHFKDEKDVDVYLGQEYDLIAIEESNQLSYSKLKFLFTCLRTSKPNWRPRAYLTTNPGGVGHVESKKIWYEPWKEGREKETRFIHATVYDNKFINKEYVQQLETLTGWQRQAWLYGSWDFMAGAYFSNFTPDVHVYPNAKVTLDYRTIRRWFAAFDFGFAHNTAAVLIAEDKNGVLWIVGEYLDNEKVIDEHAENIKAMLRKHHITPSDLDFFVAGKDCFHRDAYGKTIATGYEECGITLSPAEVDRVNGWQRCHQRFGDISKAIQPTCYVSADCPNLIEQIQAAQHSEKRVGDIEKFNANPEGEGGDDLLDAFRMAISSDPSTAIHWAIPMQVGRYTMIGC